MNKNLITLSLILITASIFAQENKKNLFKINAVPIFSGVYEFQYERVLNENSSIQVGFGTGNKTVTDLNEFQELHLETFNRNLNNPRNTEYSEKTFTLNIDYRYYLKGNVAPKGLYLSPSIQYISYEERFSAEEQETSGNENGGFDFNQRNVEQEFKLFNIRALIGYQLIIANTISFNPYFGPSFAFGDAKDFFDREDEDEKGFGLNVGVYVGINF
jgi:hypothetical protein